MKSAIFLLILILACTAVDALSIGVVPDRLVFDREDELFSIINPNNATLRFRIRAEYVDCLPAEGNIAPNSRAEVLCGALPGADNDLILVEIEGADENIGIIPAVAVKAEIPGQKTGAEPGKEDARGEKEAKTGAGPLMISGQNKNSSAAGEKSDGIFHEMPAEMITIMLLTCAILFVISYPGIKKMKRKKEKTPEREETSNESTCASSTQDAQADQSSAAASASQHPPE